MAFAARTLARFVACALCAAPFGTALAQLDVTTQRYDDARLGANLVETQLTTSNVNAGNFGKLWSYTVSGSVYAQPLYVRDVTIPGQGTHNVLYVVTMNDRVYAFDADSNADTPLLEFDVTSEVPGSTPIPILQILGFNDNIIGNVGIESTPVIDLSTNTMYLVARTLETSSNCGSHNPTFCQKLHALDITTFEERPGSPVILGGSVPGNGSGSQGGTLAFDPKIEDQRASLALSNGRVFVAWSSHSDQFPYHGWVMVYDAATLQQTLIWSSAPDGTSFNGAGIWMAGRAPAIDADGNVYYMTGNGTWDGTTNFGESFVKFGATPDTPLLDWFTPSAVDLLNDLDLDLAGSGPILVPGTNLIVGAGKSGVFYVTRIDDLGGHVASGDTNIVQHFDNSRFQDDHEQIKGGPVYWNRNGGLGPWMYVWSDGCNHFNAYRFNGTDFDLPPVSQSTMLSPCGSSGGVLTLSANGSAPGSGIVWVSMPVAGDANSGIHPGMLRAFDADDLSTELWNSNQNQGRDDAGNWPKFSAPTVVNGRVYLGSFPDDGFGDTHVNVYGLLVAPGDFSLTATPPNPGTNPGGSVVYTIDIAAQNGFADPVHLDVGTLPAGVTATFAGNDLTPPAETTLTLDVDASVALGEYPLAIVATSGALQHGVDNGFYVTDAAAGAGVVSIDFVGNGVLLAATDLAGVVSKPNWNEPIIAAGSGLALVDESGADTGATLDWNAGNVGSLGISGPTPDFAMMNSYLDADHGTTTIRVRDLPANPGGYFVYVYADGDNGGSDLAGVYSLVGDDGEPWSARIVDAAGATFDGTFVHVDGDGRGNYAVLFTGSNGFTLTVSPPLVGGGAHTPLNGIQIVRGDRIFGSGFD
ncbi:MAG TPA: PQQ-binding-like beta-propeller repeat protein [Rhodanobacteraceae bacterium]|nr:PQQ-binding-like beta-propeller repeat protein [Rhodanobacteraceae bacterium]